MIIREPGDEASTSMYMYLQKAVVSRTLVYIRDTCSCLPQHACLISFPAYPFNCDDIALAAYTFYCMEDEAQDKCFILLSFELKFVYCDSVCLEKIICIFFG